ncbi:hypothetical protein BC477_03540 [Clavibacter michiganensis subsp. michiganensis]|uniref:Uncharacterized protein n=1 Tax=Clavibacter michiganensis subsp. michiganensis TaxID=33013 RepID=A0A251XJU1_CLAMM|nr:hypothetical protein BC477_03540 [Clavibacter michiganensis subsp. michiganensis]OUE03785.1 hypothetical protein CMMCAS07_02475 [Clavibacter michiganensis subsp. michiganensis]
MGSSSPRRASAESAWRSSSVESSSASCGVERSGCGTTAIVKGDGVWVTGSPNTTVCFPRRMPPRASASVMAPASTRNTASNGISSVIAGTS